MTYKNKVLTCLGDSITNKTFRAPNNYVALIEEQMDFKKVYNLGISGSGYRRWEEKGMSFSGQAEDIPLDTDLVTVMGSFNDLDTKALLGAWDDSLNLDKISLGACMNDTIDTIQRRLPLAKLGIIAPYPWAFTNSKEEDSLGVMYVELLETICFKRGIPFLNLFRKSNLRPWEKENNKLFFAEGDGVHLNDLGHEYIFPQIREFIKTLL